jgi:hypothetical protein
MLDPAILALCIPLAAIVGGFSIVLTRMWTRHRERMAMIEMGLHPDAPDEELPPPREQAELPQRSYRADKGSPR